MLGLRMFYIIVEDGQCWFMLVNDGQRLMMVKESLVVVNDLGYDDEQWWSNLIQ